MKIKIFLIIFIENNVEIKEWKIDFIKKNLFKNFNYEKKIFKILDKLNFNLLKMKKRQYKNK